jgi:hypothetical protein
MEKYGTHLNFGLSQNDIKGVPMDGYRLTAEIRGVTVVDHLLRVAIGDLQDSNMGFQVSTSALLYVLLVASLLS